MAPVRCASCAAPIDGGLFCEDCAPWTAEEKRLAKKLYPAGIKAPVTKCICRWQSNVVELIDKHWCDDLYESDYDEYVKGNGVQS